MGGGGGSKNSSGVARGSSPTTSRDVKKSQSPHSSHYSSTSPYQPRSRPKAGEQHHHRPRRDSDRHREEEKSKKSRIVLNEDQVNEVISDEEHSDIELREEKSDRSGSESEPESQDNKRKAKSNSRSNSPSRSRSSNSSRGSSSRSRSRSHSAKRRRRSGSSQRSNYEDDSSQQNDMVVRAAGSERTRSTSRDYVEEIRPTSSREQIVETITYYCSVNGCRSVEEFECLNKIEEGAYGVVYRAKDKKSGEVVALKRLKMEKEKEGFPITSLREVDTLLKAQHPNIVTVREIVVGSNMDKIYMVMDYVEHDLRSLMQYSMKKPFLMSEVKCLMRQILSGVAHLHDNWIIHRDLKTSNLLLSHKGVLKIADFGLAREYGSPLKKYTSVVVTLWYRSPELLLGTELYSTAIDIWSVGCIFGELMLQKALFQGRNEKDQLDKIFKDLGTPTDAIWPGWRELPLAKNLKFPSFPYNTLRSRFGTYLSDNGLNLLNSFLTYDPGRRMAADDALRHEFFDEKPFPLDPSMFPSWPAKSEGPSKVKKDPEEAEPKAPSAGRAFNNLVIEEQEGFVLQGAVSKAPPAGFRLK